MRKQSRSVKIQLSMRTINDIGKLLDSQEPGNKRDRAKASLIRARLERALQLSRN